ncbi:MAG: DUF6430 domain-containing protein, partial [Eubacterium sp.]
VKRCKWLENVTAEEINIIITRILIFAAVWTLITFIYWICQKCQKWITIKGDNYTIKIEYGDLLKVKNCKKVINFDECFSTNVGSSPADIKQTSVCGQYLKMNPNLDMQQIINRTNLKPARAKSKLENKERYESGSIVQNGDDLLLAFARLDENGSGRFFTRDEYIDCLFKMWIELDKYYGQQDVCIPILGAGLTRFDGGSGASIPQQELLDMIIWSYKLSSHKIKAPYKLRIMCRRSDDFSLNKIDSHI